MIFREVTSELLSPIILFHRLSFFSYKTLNNVYHFALVYMFIAYYYYVPYLLYCKLPLGMNHASLFMSVISVWLTVCVK